MFARLRAAWTAFRTTPAGSAGAPTENAIRGDLRDSATAVQAQSIRDVHTGPTHHADTHHHTGGVQYTNSAVHYGQGDQIGTVTNNNFGGSVGAQMGHVNGGVINVGGSSSITGSAIGHGARVANVVGTNYGQVVSGGDIHGGVTFRR